MKFSVEQAKKLKHVLEKYQAAKKEKHNNPPNNLNPRKSTIRSYEKPGTSHKLDTFFTFMLIGLILLFFGVVFYILRKYRSKENRLTRKLRKNFIYKPPDFPIK